MHRYNGASNDEGQGRVTDNLSRAELSGVSDERRRPNDRRRRTLRALLYGSMNPRRLASRRDGEHGLAGVDWHHPQWLAVAMLTLIMCVADALLTLMLIQRGAYEANPFMEPLVHGSALVFTVVKFGLTAGGITVLILLARARLFRNVPVASILYGVLLVYAVLIGYEVWMLETLSEPL
jgi:hypothetical protein